MNESSVRDAILRTEQLSKNYPDGQVQALRDVNLSIARGEYVALMGPSGSGKSTLLNMIGALDRPTSGEVYIDGEPLSTLTDLDKLRSQQIGFVFQSFLLIPTLTALENVQVPMFEGSRSASERATKAAELLESVKMSHREGHLDSPAYVGERQRVAIARSLANDPKILLADEPTGNLDTKTAEEVLDLFEHLHKNLGLTVVMVTHSVEVAHHADRVITVRDGAIVSDEAVQHAASSEPLPESPS